MNKILITFGFVLSCLVGFIAGFKVGQALVLFAIGLHIAFYILIVVGILTATAFIYFKTRK